MIKLSKFKRMLICIMCFILAIPSQFVYAFFQDTNSEYAFYQTSYDADIYILNDQNPRGRVLKSQYPNNNLWRIVDYGNGKDGKFKTFLPIHFDSVNLANPNNYNVLKGIVENQRNKYGQGGLHLVNSSNWNIKYGWDLPYGINENNYDEKGGNIKLPDGRMGEFRYIGYDQQGHEMNNPFFPDDRASIENAWEKNWIPFNSGGKYYGGMSEHVPSEINSRYQDEAREILTEFFLDHEVGQKMIQSYIGKAGMDGKSYSVAFKDGFDGKILTDEAFDYWNSRFRIDQKKSDLNIMLTGNWKRKSDGHVLYQTFAMAKKVKESTFIRNFKLNEPSNDEALTKSNIRETRLGRSYGGAPISEIQNKSYFMESQSRTRTLSENEPPVFSLGGQYQATGEIVFTKIDPKTEEDIKIGEPTKTQPPKIHFQYQYYDAISKKWYTVADGNSFNDYFWEGKVPDSPLVAGRHQSSTVTAKIKWPHDIDSSKKQYTWGRVIMKIPENFLKNKDDYWEPDNYTFLEFKIAAGNDMGMKEPVVLKNPQGNPVEGPEVGNDHTLDFTVENLTEQEIKDPNTTIDVTVVDKTTNDVIYKDTVVADKVTGPNQEVVITTPAIKIPSNKVEACAVINKVHKEQGENLIEANDTVCAEFGSRQDMEMRASVKLMDTNNKVTEQLQANKSHRVNFGIKNVLGAVDVGTVGNKNPNNPNAKINVEIRDENNKVIHKKDYQAGQVIKPNGTLEITTGSFSHGNSSEITACAVIDKIHDEKGFNIRSEKDKVCETFSMKKNLSVPEFVVEPNFIEKPKNVTSFNQTVTFRYKVGYEALGNTQLSTKLVISSNGKKITEIPIYIKPGEIKEGTVSGNLTGIRPNQDITFKAEVNPVVSGKRPITEVIGQGKDPYFDNAKTATLNTRSIPDCIDCQPNNKKTSENRWREKIIWKKVVANPKAYYGPFKITDQNGRTRTCDGHCTCGGSPCYDYCSGHSRKGSHSSSCSSDCKSYHWEYYDCASKDCSTYHYHDTHYCSGHRICVTNDWEHDEISDTPKERDYKESYEIKNIYFRSKWSKDKFGGDGWVNVKTLGETPKVKAGYPFEIKVETLYKTDRKPGNYPAVSPEFIPKDGTCKKIIKPHYPTDEARPPSTTDRVYLKVNGLKEDCYIMERTYQGGNWWEETTAYELPERDKKSSTDQIRAIYVPETAKPQEITVNLATALQGGYKPSSSRVVRVYTNGGKFLPLQDCDSFKIQIIANNDLNTSIIQ